MQRLCFASAAVSILILAVTPGFSIAANPASPPCAPEASTAALDDIIHLYGDSLGEFSVPDSFPVFSMVFDLYVTDSVTVRWDASEISYFIDQIMDNDSTDMGVYVEDNSATTGKILRCRFEDNSLGISYYRSSRPWIDNCTIQSNSLGIHCDTYSHVTIQHCITSQSYSGKITNNGGGLLCTNNASPQMGTTEISSSGTGVYSDTGCNPDFQALGDNSFKSNTNYHIVNQTLGLTIAAQGNYWYPNRNGLPKSTMFMGSVDYANPDSTAPNPASAYQEAETSRPMPKTYELTSLYPNPFNPTIQIKFGLPERAGVEIDIFDVRGRRVRSLVREEIGPGYHVRVWNGIDDNGVPAASAVYFLRMRASQFVESRKIVLIR